MDQHFACLVRLESIKNLKDEKAATRVKKIQRMSKQTLQNVLIVKLERNQNQEVQNVNFARLENSATKLVLAARVVMLVSTRRVEQQMRRSVSSVDLAVTN